MIPPDIIAFKRELIESRLASVRELARECRLCPRECGVDRPAGELGTCRIEYGPVYSSANLHYGEEPPISGSRGSGTIFLTGCNLRCLFCQNYPISQLRHGNRISIEDLAGLMLRLQREGAHNINIVTPTPQAAAIFEALAEAYRRGLNIPLVYNCGGYESLEMLKLWEGIMDIYMPDIKYADDRYALKLSNAPAYAQHNRAAILEMHRQVGVLQLDSEGVAVKGLLIRHLVLPQDYSSSVEALAWIAREVSPQTYISLMSQYFPAWRAVEEASLNRRLKRWEYRQATEALAELGLENGWTQPY